MENVLENARRHGRLPVRAELSREGEGVWVWLVDAGPGFPEDLLPRVLEPFVHGGKGTGLGLAICRGFIRALGGTITVQDGPAGRGARMIIALPHVPMPSLQKREEDAA